MQSNQANPYTIIKKTNEP